MKHPDKPARHRRSPAALREIVNQFAHSPLSRAAFCRQHALSPATFERWRRRLSIPDEAQAHDSTTDLFVQLGIDGEPESDSANHSRAPAWDIELQIGEAMVLRLRRPC